MPRGATRRPAAGQTKPAKVADDPASPGQPVDAAAAQEPSLSVEAILAAVNDGADDPETVDAVNVALYRFGAQDPSMDLPRSWQRVQRRIGVEADGVATAEQVAEFAHRVGLAVK